MNLEQRELVAALRDLIYEKPCALTVSPEALAAIRAAAEPAPPTLPPTRLELHPTFRVDHTEQWHRGREQLQAYLEQVAEAHLLADLYAYGTRMREVYRNVGL